MNTDYNKPELSLEELAIVVCGTGPIKVVMDAYNATLKEIAAPAILEGATAMMHSISHPAAMLSAEELDHVTGSTGT